MKNDRIYKTLISTKTEELLLSNVIVFSLPNFDRCSFDKGGTIDMTVHKVKRGGKLQELSKASGGDWGGVMVDRTFKTMLTDIVGEEFLEKYCKQYTAEYIELFKDFEVKKRQRMIESSQSGKITLKISATFLEEFKNDCGRTISQRTKETRYADSLKWSGDKLRMKQEVFQSFFKPSSEKIVNHIKELLEPRNVRDTKIILMVGGFSESEIVQDAVRKAFPEYRIVIPQEAGLAVLKGAVIFGHDPSVIDARIAKYTYGIEVCELFDPNKHEERRKERDKKDGKYRCHGIFSRHVEAGTILYRNEEQREHIYFPIYADQKKISFPVYISEKSGNPTYTDEPGCKWLGQLEMDISNTSGGLDRKFAAKLKFGGTEITVTAKNIQTNQIVHTNIDFLSGEP